MTFLFRCDVPPDFEVSVEVYSHRMSESLAVASTPKKIKKKFNDFSLNFGRRLSGLVSDLHFTLFALLYSCDYFLLERRTR